MRKKVVNNMKAYEQMKKVYETRGLTVVEVKLGKAEAYDKDGVKRHELVCEKVGKG